MADYKLYCIATDGHIAMRHDYDACDDLTSLERARELCGEYEIEIWQGVRFVARVAKDGTASAAGPAAQTVPLPPPKR
jgi:hypothetical protein